jgi:hypothetical protein
MLEQPDPTKIKHIKVAKKDILIDDRSVRPGFYRRDNSDDTPGYGYEYMSGTYFVELAYIYVPNIKAHSNSDIINNLKDAFNIFFKDVVSFIDNNNMELSYQLFRKLDPRASANGMRINKDYTYTYSGIGEVTMVVRVISSKVKLRDLIKKHGDFIAANNSVMNSVVKTGKCLCIRDGAERLKAEFCKYVFSYTSVETENIFNDIDWHDKATGPWAIDFKSYAVSAVRFSNESDKMLFALLAA